MYGDRSGAGAIGGGQAPKQGEVNVLALARGGEQFVFVWSDDQRDELLRTFGRFAANPELSFSWQEASVLSQKLREQFWWE